MGRKKDNGWFLCERIGNCQSPLLPDEPFVCFCCFFSLSVFLVAFVVKPLAAVATGGNRAGLGRIGQHRAGAGNNPEESGSGCTLPYAPIPGKIAQHM